MALELVTLNDLEDHLPVAGFLKCNPSNICAAFYPLSTDSVLARSVSDSWTSCMHLSDKLLEWLMFYKCGFD